MLNTAKTHFDEDLTRARDLRAHAHGLPAGSLKDDILRAAWMMGVGACDAYFSDAYADLIARALHAKDIEKTVVIPDRLNNLKVPVTAVIGQGNSAWRWRMAARELIEDENVLSLEKIQKLFNHFFRKGHKLLTTETIEKWILHSGAKSRLFGITSTAYKALNSSQKHTARTKGLEQFNELFEGIFQRRHDCIHNCDRPKVAPQTITSVMVEKKLQDIEFLVCRAHEALRDEFPTYLRRLGFNSTTRNSVCG
jgi:hypothetical protein